jgi:hypothetical protein
LVKYHETMWRNIPKKKLLFQERLLSIFGTVDSKWILLCPSSHILALLFVL